MSRIGKKLIPLPSGVHVVVGSDRVTIEGPQGTLEVKLPPSTTITENMEPRALSVTVAHPDNVKERAMWGLARQLLANAVAGVQKPYQKSLEFVGVGFKVARVDANTLTFDVGFSHSVAFVIPPEITATIDKQTLVISGIDKQLVGETAAQIRRVKPPEPYKGKGIKYTAEVIRRKAGKAATKTAT